MAGEPVLWVLTILGVLAFAAAVASLVDGHRFRRRVLAARVWDRNAFLPPALVLVPCRGIDADLASNLDAILSQEYPRHRVVFCVDRLDDPAVPVIERVRARHPVPSEIATALDSPATGGKALALLGGLASRTPEDEVVVFLDSDIRPHRRFLRTLVQPLVHPAIGATTGYRWYVPTRGGFWSVARSAWNAAGLNVFFSDRYNFLWGGAWAIRRETLNRLDLAALWRGTLSEDLAATAAIKAMGLRVQFVPQAMAPTFEDCDRRRCKEWTDRQTAMVALWGRDLRNFAALTYGVFNGALILGVLSAALAAFLDPWFAIPALLFLFDVPATVAKGEHRRRSVFLGTPELAARWRVSGGRWAAANLVVPWLIAGNLVRTRRVRAIEWRGKRYEVGPRTVGIEGGRTPSGK